MTKSVFSKIWYLPEENSWKDLNMLAMKDSGTLVVEDGLLVFTGKKETVKISEIEKVSYGKQGRDSVNNWVKIEYRGGKEAFFADGSFLGWGGMLGGTKKVLKAAQQQVAII